METMPTVGSEIRACQKSFLRPKSVGWPTTRAFLAFCPLPPRSVPADRHSEEISASYVIRARGQDFCTEERLSL